MSDNMDYENIPLRANNVPEAVSKRHAKKLTEDINKSGGSKKPQGEEYSLNDDRRVKVLSPGALVSKRFFRNRIAVTGLVILLFMFIFSFLGGVVTPYAEDEIFYTTTYQQKTYAGVIENKDFRYAQADGQDFNSVLQAQMLLAVTTGKDSFSYRDVEYTVASEGEDFYSVSLSGGDNIGIAYKDIINASSVDSKLSYELQFNSLKAYTNGETSFSADGTDYTIDEDGVVFAGGEEVAYISRYVVNAVMSDVFISRAFKEELAESIDEGNNDFFFTDTDGETHEYVVTYEPDTTSWTVTQSTETRVFDTYAAPSKAHWLGTDGNGMDMLTRLMYGGRVSLIIGFIVVIIESVIGVILGGIAGYFGKWVDNLIMRIARPDPLPARAGVHDRYRGLRHQRVAPHLQAPGAERNAPADSFLHHGARLHDNTRGHAFVPRPRRQVPVCVMGQYHQRRKQYLCSDQLLVHLDPGRRSAAADRPGVQPRRRRPARCVRPEDEALRREEEIWQKRTTDICPLKSRGAFQERTAR